MEYLEKYNRPKTFLFFGNILLIFFLILFSNFGSLPFKNISDFAFFVFVILLFSLYRPGWAFLFFIGTLALENINVAPESLPVMLRPYQLLGLLGLIAIIIKFSIGKLGFKLPKWTKWDLIVAIFFMSGFLSLINSPEKLVSLKLSVIVASFSVMYLFVRIFIQEIEDLKKIVPFFMTSFGIVALYGIWQNWRFLNKLPHFETMPGRPNSTFVEADWLGMFLIFGLALVYTLIFYFYTNKLSESHFLDSYKRINIRSKILIGIYWILIALVYAAIILTVARSAWLSGLVVSILFFVFCFVYFSKSRDKKIIQIPLFMIASFLLALFLTKAIPLTNFELSNRAKSTGIGLQEITISCASENELRDIIKIGKIENINQLEISGCRHINLEEIESEKTKGFFVGRIKRDDPNVNIRAEIYKKSWEEIKNNPILGIGWGSIYEILGKDDLGNRFNSSNIFIEVWLGSGILGLLSFLAIWLYILSKSLKNILNILSKNFELERDGEEMYFSLFILLGWFALTISNLFNAGIMLGFLWAWVAVSFIKSTSRTK